MIWSKLCTQLKYHRGIILVKIVYWEYPTETDGSTSLSNNTRDQGLNLYMELMRVHSSTMSKVWDGKCQCQFKYFELWIDNVITTLWRGALVTQLRWIKVIFKSTCSMIKVFC